MSSRKTDWILIDYFHPLQWAFILLAAVAHAFPILVKQPIWGLGAVLGLSVGFAIGVAVMKTVYKYILEPIPSRVPSLLNTEKWAISGIIGAAMLIVYYNMELIDPTFVLYPQLNLLFGTIYISIVTLIFIGLTLVLTILFRVPTWYSNRKKEPT